MWVNEIIGWQDVKLEIHQIIIIHTFVIHILSTAEAYLTYLTTFLKHKNYSQIKITFTDINY